MIQLIGTNHGELAAYSMYEAIFNHVQPDIIVAEANERLKAVAEVNHVH